jgi:hypothetical protein
MYKRLESEKVMSSTEFAEDNLISNIQGDLLCLRLYYLYFILRCEILPFLD